MTKMSCKVAVFHQDIVHEKLQFITNSCNLCNYKALMMACEHSTEGEKSTAQCMLSASWDVSQQFLWQLNSGLYRSSIKKDRKFNIERASTGGTEAGR